MLDFIGPISHEVTLANGTTETQTVKCTRNAAASIALACSESSYEQASLMLSRLAGLDIDAMTEHRVTDSVGSEFVEVSPAGIELAEIEEMAKKFGGNILKTRLNELNASADKDEVIQNALNDKPDGVFYSEYDGPSAPSG